MGRPNPFARKPMPIKISPLIFVVVICVLLVMLFVIILTVKSWVNVASGEIAIFVKKTGITPETGSTIMAPDETYKAIQHEMLPEGWHFKNYFVWERVSGEEFQEKVTIGNDRCGVLTRLFGEDLPEGEVLARKSNQKGIVPGVLEPGTHTINRLAYDLIKVDAVQIDPGYVGIVLNKAGNVPDATSVFVVKGKERGVQPQTLPPSTRYINPFEQMIIPVDMRSQIYQLGQVGDASHAGQMVGKPITFPSRDGFNITLEGKIEWKIDPERASEVFVKYVDNRPVITCVVEKIILPNTRSFTRIYGSMEDARNFIEGSTRQQFQEKLFMDLQKQCAAQGIVILNVSITEMQPPTKIANLINDREVAKRLKAKYLKEQEREKQEKQLAMEKKLQLRSRQVKQVEARMSVMKTEAQRDKEVAIVQADQQLSVAKLELEASRKQANAIISKGQAQADVIGFQNIAKASGIAKAAEAFRSGEGYARYLFLQKVAPGFVYILANTDGPFIKVFQELFDKENTQ